MVKNIPCYCLAIAPLNALGIGVGIGECLKWDYCEAILMMVLLIWGSIKVVLLPISNPNLCSPHLAVLHATHAMSGMTA